MDEHAALCTPANARNPSKKHKLDRETLFVIAHVVPIDAEREPVVRFFDSAGMCRADFASTHLPIIPPCQSSQGVGKTTFKKKRRARNHPTPATHVRTVHFFRALASEAGSFVHSKTTRQKFAGFS